jgi:hypothetical protein
MRWSLAFLACCVLLLGACHEYHVSYSISVNADATPNPTYAGLTITLSSRYSTDNANAYVTDHDWTVTSAAGGYTLQDDGFTAEFTPTAVGTYVVRYRTWYYTNWDSGCCYYPTSYREVYVTVSVVPGPSA